MKSLLALASLILTINCYASEPSSSLMRELDSINEQPIKNLATSSKIEIYRFYWSRSSKSTLTYTIDLTSTNKPTLIIKKFSKKDPQTLLSETKTELTKTHLQNLKSFLNGAQFWTLPSEEKNAGLDGATWILEGIKDGQYHYTERWSPLPPYFGWTGTWKDGELVMKRLNPPFEKQVKHSDEVGLDFLCLYIMLMADQEPEVIY
ncbi:hypothetical protein [Aquipseudomonas campi]